MAAKALAFPLAHQGVCGWHGTEDLCVTPGDLAWFAPQGAIRDPIRANPGMGTDAWREVGALNSTVPVCNITRRHRKGRLGGLGKAARDDDREEKGRREEKRRKARSSSLSENPLYHSQRRLSDGINPGDEKVYSPQNLRLAWERVAACVRLHNNPRWLHLTISMHAEAYSVPSNVIQARCWQRLSQQAADRLAYRSGA